MARRRVPSPLVGPVQAQARSAATRAIVAGVVATVVVASTGRSLGGVSVSGEYGLKAALLLNLTLFVEWPDGVLAEGTPLEIRVLGRAAGDEIRQALASKSARSRAVRVVVHERAKDLTAGHVLFVAGEAVLEQPEALRWAAGRPVLTVTESPTTMRPGPVIALAADGTRLTFEVDLDAAEVNHVRPVARLLSLAKRVHGERLSRVTP